MFRRSFMNPDRVARKASNVSAADWRYQTHVKKIRHIFTSVVATFLSAFHINHSLYEKSHLSRGKIELKNGIACPLGAAVYLRYFKSFKLIYEDLSMRVSVAWFGVGIARSAKIYHHNETCAPHRRNSKIICKITKDNTLASPL